jgi:hypothetical protein
MEIANSIDALLFVWFDYIGIGSGLASAQARAPAEGCYPASIQVRQHEEHLDRSAAQVLDRAWAAAGEEESEVEPVFCLQ